MEEMMKVAIQGRYKKKSKMAQYLYKMRGGERAPARVNFVDAITGAFGGLISICTLLLLTKYTDSIWLMASFGGSCVLAFVVWNAPLSQPRNIIGGHFISAAIGLLVFQVMGTSIGSISIAIGLTVFCMAYLGCIHPPAGANPIIIMIEGYKWSYLFMPVLLGAVIIVIYAVLINNLRQTRKYPLFW